MQACRQKATNTKHVFSYAAAYTLTHIFYTHETVKNLVFPHALVCDYTVLGETCLYEELCFATVYLHRKYILKGTVRQLCLTALRLQFILKLKTHLHCINMDVTQHKYASLTFMSRLGTMKMRIQLFFFCFFFLLSIWYGKEKSFQASWNSSWQGQHKCKNFFCDSFQRLIE